MAKPGAKKGTSKPPKRVLDAGFPGRLKAAMKAKDWDVPRLAKEARCTRQVLHKYLKRQSKTIEAHLLFAVSDALTLSARWLLQNDGGMDRVRALTPDQSRVLELFGHLDDRGRETWLDQGEVLRRRQPSLMPTASDPYPTAPRAKAKA